MFEENDWGGKLFAVTAIDYYVNTNAYSSHTVACESIFNKEYTLESMIKEKIFLFGVKNTNNERRNVVNASKELYSLTEDFDDMGYTYATDFDQLSDALKAPMDVGVYVVFAPLEVIESPNFLKNNYKFSDYVLFKQKRDN